MREIVFKICILCKNSKAIIITEKVHVYKYLNFLVSFWNQWQLKIMTFSICVIFSMVSEWPIAYDWNLKEKYKLKIMKITIFRVEILVSVVFSKLTIPTFSLKILSSWKTFFFKKIANTLYFQDDCRSHCLHHSFFLYELLWF